MTPQDWRDLAYVFRAGAQELRSSDPFTIGSRQQACAYDVMADRCLSIAERREAQVRRPRGPEGEPL